MLSLLGDLQEALRLASRASATADASGWSKGTVAAAANSAFLCVQLGMLGDAKKHLVQAAAQGYKGASYDLALRETEAQLLYCLGDHAGAEASLRTRDDITTAAQPWYQLSNEVTLIRILLAQNRFGEALSSIQPALKVAEAVGIESFVLDLKIARANAAIGLGRQPQAGDLPIGTDTSSWPVARRGQ